MFSSRRVIAGALSTKPPSLSARWNNVIQLNDNSRRACFARYSTETATSVPHVEAPKPLSKFRRVLGFSALAIFAFVAGVSIAPMQIASRLTVDSIPSDSETLEIFQPSDEISHRVENYIKTHPLAQKLRSLPNYTETRPHLKIPGEFRRRHLVAGTLFGPNRVVVPPYVFCEKSGKELVAITYLGQELCGHPGIVHGGMLATILDEGLARCCFPVLPNGIGVTANLSINYRKPVLADKYVVLRAETVKHEGRKAWVEGRLETLPEGDEEPVVLAEAKGLFVEPKYASKLPSLYKAVTE